jgi:hypothetical protein
MVESKKVLAVKWGPDSDGGCVDLDDVFERGKESLPTNSDRILETSQAGSVWLF